jgi:acetoin utilization deacetylase AcuC-like enzyme
MQKYDQVAAALERLGWCIERAEPIATTDYLRVHDVNYLERVAACSLDAKAERRLGFPQSPALVARAQASVAGTVAAAERALEVGLGVHLAGGTHHAFADRGEGFCLYNDLVIAARRLQATRKGLRVLIVDADVHQGNGSAALCAEEERIVTYSIHGERNYPLVKVPSDVDVALPDGCGDDDYLQALDESLRPLMAQLAPDLVLYQGGVDVLAGDRFGRLALSVAGVVQRERLVSDLCLSVGASLATTLGGGYHRDLGQTVAAHVSGLSIVAERFGVGSVT